MARRWQELLGQRARPDRKAALSRLVRASQFQPATWLAAKLQNQHQKSLEALATACEGAIELRFNLKRVGFIQAKKRWGLPGRMGWQWTLFQPHEGQCITQAPFVQTQQSRPCCTSCTSLARRGSAVSFHPRRHAGAPGAVAPPMKSRRAVAVCAACVCLLVTRLTCRGQ